MLDIYSKKFVQVIIFNNLIVYALDKNIILFIKLIYIYNIACVWSVAFSMDGQYIAFGSSEKSINLIDFKQKKIYQIFDKIHKGNILVLLKLK